MKASAPTQPGRRERGSGGGPLALTPALAVRIAALGGIAAVALAILLVRLWFLQVVGSESYSERAEGNRLREVVTEAPRGLVTDRRGVVLVGNRSAQNLVARPRELTGGRRRAVLAKLSARVDVPLTRLLARVKAGENTPFQSVVLVPNVDRNVALYLAERKRQFPGIGLQETFVRDYRQSTTLAHVVGQVGAIPADHLAEYRSRGYGGDERVGVAGIEAEYEEWLRGTPGRVVVEVDAAGEPIGRGIVSQVAPRSGNNLELTIDLGIQKGLEAALAEQYAANGLATGAAGVALDPRTGEVLAMASVPVFDPEVFVRGRARQIARLNADPTRPLLNRATLGQYPAGSTFKPVSATAALERGQLQPEEILESAPEVELYDTVFPNFENASHGLINLRQALEVSSDTFFYQIGARFYEAEGSPLQEIAARFGFGKPTGVDLAGEEPGLLPTVEWKRRHFADSPFPLDRSWKPGDSINLSVGQGNLLVTPLQMAVAYGGLATGTIRTPILGRRVVSASGDPLRQLAAEGPERPVPASNATLAEVRDGLWRATNGGAGTASAVFAPIPDEDAAAGKTGTAEQVGGEDHSWFVGYAPASDPRVVVAIVIERGGTGANAAAPAVCKTIAAALRFDAASCGSGAVAN